MVLALLGETKLAKVLAANTSSRRHVWERLKRLKH